MLSGVSLDKAIGQLISRPFRHTFFRAMPLRFAQDPLGKRRPIVAQRFNLAGGPRVLYLGEDQIACLHEIQVFGWPVGDSNRARPIRFESGCRSS